MSFWNRLDPRYRLVLCDIWGVVHDGVALQPGVTDRLHQWRSEGRFVILLTNAPRTASDVERQLVGLGLPRDCWDAIVTSGEAGIAALKALGAPAGFIGTSDDRAVLEGRGVLLADEGFTDLACTGLDEDRPEPPQYRAQLERLAAAGVRMHCLNPDRMVVRGGMPEACAGALADAYEALGGEVAWYGKPFQPIYRHALHVAGEPRPDRVLAVGDGIQTDMLGAATMGFDAVLVSCEAPGDVCGLPGWRPLAVVEGLG